MSVAPKPRASKRHHSGAVRVAVYALWLCSIVVTLGVNSGRAGLPAGDPNSDPASDPAADSDARIRLRRAVTAVGLVLVSDGGGERPRPRGSGVVIRQDGVIVTNWHVIRRDDSDQQFREIYFSLAPDSGASPLESSCHRMQVLEIDREIDLVLMRLAPGGEARPNPALLALPYLELGDSRAVELLDDLVIIGFPTKGGSTATVSRGVVEGKDNAEGWIKTDARLLHGNSGGAAVNAEGKLIGIATKVEIDRAQNDLQLGTVGYLRPSHLISQMLERSIEKEKADAGKALAGMAPSPSANSALSPVKVKGLVKFAVNGRPIAGARVGLIVAGREVAPEALITWGGTNADGYFQFEKAVLPGKYTLRAKVIGDERYASYNQEVEIKPDLTLLIVEIEATKNR